MTNDDSQQPELDHDNAERLAALLHVLAASADEDSPAITIDTLDGYLHALLSGPAASGLAAPADAMDALFGEDWPAPLQEQEQIDAFMDALHLRWNEIADSLAPEPLIGNPEAMRLVPLITEFDETMKAELLSQGVLKAELLERLPAAGQMWVEGFMQAVQDHQADWYQFEADSEAGQMLDAMLMSVAAVALPEGEQRQAYIAEAYDEDVAVDQHVLIDDALFSVQDLRLFWLQQAAATGDDTAA
ncbi:MAG TPA: UPF0149 family protein [Roseateles sp.]|nr:UPF0149 family protein [Roseateles sp.]